MIVCNLRIECHDFKGCHNDKVDFRQFCRLLVIQLLPLTFSLVTFVDISPHFSPHFLLLKLLRLSATEGVIPALISIWALLFLINFPLLFEPFSLACTLLFEPHLAVCVLVSSKRRRLKIWHQLLPYLLYVVLCIILQLESVINRWALMFFKVFLLRYFLLVL